MTQREQPKMHLYQPNEERLNTISHAIAAVLSVVGLIFMLLKINGKDGITIFAMMIFCLCLIGVYTSSAIYHGTTNLLHKRIWQKVDHAMVALILCGSAAPLLLVIAKGMLAAVMLSLVFVVTVINIALNLICVQRFRRYSLALIGITVALTIIGVVVARGDYPQQFFAMLGAGFAVIFAGSGFYLKKSSNYTHFVWHLSNIFATALLYFAFYFYAL